MVELSVDCVKLESWLDALKAQSSGLTVIHVESGYTHSVHSDKTMPLVSTCVRTVFNSS